MKYFYSIAITFLLCSSTFAQCPDLKLAMINSCGANEGNNEFVLFQTGEANTVSKYNLNYSTSNSPFTAINNLSGLDASPRTGTGSISTNNTCPIAEKTNPTDSIPANKRVIFIPANFDQNYLLSGLCNGTDSLYVVYIDIVSPSSNSIWLSGGNFVNGGSNRRYLQLDYNGNIACSQANMPVKSYVPQGNWPVTSGTAADGNFVSWNDTTASYANEGCSALINPVPLKFIGIYASNLQDANVIHWETNQEISITGFDIEKSYNGKDFISIGFMNAIHNNSAVNNKYQFNDNQIELKTTYYRIKSTDVNGRLEYSKIATITPTKSGININALYPNPAKNKVTIEWNCAKKGTSCFIIQDYVGKTLKKEYITSYPGFNQYQLNVASFPHGKYIIRIITDEEVVNRTFTK